MTDAETASKAAAGNQSWKRSPAERLFFICVGVLPIGLISSHLVLGFLNVAARSLYAAFEPEYRVRKKWSDDLF